MNSQNADRPLSDPPHWARLGGSEQTSDRPPVDGTLAERERIRHRTLQSPASFLHLVGIRVNRHRSDERSLPSGYAETAEQIDPLDRRSVELVLQDPAWLAFSSRFSERAPIL